MINLTFYHTLWIVNDSFTIMKVIQTYQHVHSISLSLIRALIVFSLQSLSHSLALSSAHRTFVTLSVSFSRFLERSVSFLQHYLFHYLVLTVLVLPLAIVRLSYSYISWHCNNPPCKCKVLVLFLLLLRISWQSPLT